MNITLIGMPASGKSCMGRALSKKLGMTYIDTDKLIEAEVGESLSSIISNRGIEEFKRLEENTLKAIEGDGLVISTGGSAIYYPDAMKHLKSISRVIYLYVGFDVIKERLGDFSKRGVVLKPGYTVQDLFIERAPLYQKYADIIINCNGTEYRKYQTDILNILKNS